VQTSDYLFERTRQSAWLDDPTTLLDTGNQAGVNACVPKHLLFEEFINNKLPQNPDNAFADKLIISRFQNFAAGATKKTPRFPQFFETAFRVV